VTQALSLVGKRFGRLTVKRRVENSDHGKTRWLCECACGKEYETLGAVLARGSAKSCGCLKRERAQALRAVIRGCDVLEQYVVTPDGCHEWTASTNRGGYGTLRVGDKAWKAHRLAYRRKVGPIPRGMHVLHRCDNPPCINPDHLWIGTHTDNMRDRSAKGRWKGNKKHD
jgi:hypothetical protein